MFQTGNLGPCAREGRAADSCWDLGCPGGLSTWDNLSGPKLREGMTLGFGAQRNTSLGGPFDPQAPAASDDLCLGLERPKGKLGGL